jgi:CRP/FNR family transcriptional regulator
MPDRDVAAFLATVPLLEGREAPDLAELARAMRERTAAAGDVLWQQGDEAREVLFVVDGALTATLQVPGGRTVEIGRAGPGQIVGEIGLLDGRGHTMRVQAAEPTTMLALGRLDFEAMLRGRQPAAFALKRRLLALFTARFRAQLQLLGGEVPAAVDAPALADLEPCRPPDSRYMRRMATFHDFDPLALWGFLTSGTYVRCPPGRTLVAEGTPSPAYFLTVNGAVERVLVRGERRIRVGLAGPGKAFGYESLIDGQPSPLAAVTRERSVLLLLQGEHFDALFHREDAVARVFLEAIQRDLLASLRQTLRPAARLAASL